MILHQASCCSPVAGIVGDGTEAVGRSCIVFLKPHFRERSQKGGGVHVRSVKDMKQEVELYSISYIRCNAVKATALVCAVYFHGQKVVR